MCALLPQQMHCGMSTSVHVHVMLRQTACFAFKYCRDPAMPGQETSMDCISLSILQLALPMATYMHALGSSGANGAHAIGHAYSHMISHRETYDCIITT